MKTTLLALLALAALAFSAAHDDKHNATDANIEARIAPLLPGNCTRPVDPGSICVGKKKSIKYAYNIRVRQCVSFIYDGCDGNVNRYDTLMECRKTCEAHGF